MKRLVIFLLIVVVVVFGFGLVREWFGVSAAMRSDQSTEKVGIELSIDKDKVRDDAAKAEQAASDALDATADAIQRATETPKKQVEPKSAPKQ